MRTRSSSTTKLYSKKIITKKRDIMADTSHSWRGCLPDRQVGIAPLWGSSLYLCWDCFHCSRTTLLFCTLNKQNFISRDLVRRGHDQQAQCAVNRRTLYQLRSRDDFPYDSRAVILKRPIMNVLATFWLELFWLHTKQLFSKRTSSTAVLISSAHRTTSAEPCEAASNGHVALDTNFPETADSYLL